MMKWIKRIVSVLVGLLLVGLLLLIGAILVDEFSGPDTIDFANVTYTGEDEVTLLGYLARPEGEGPFPAVLMLHEWWGLNEGITELADAMAEQGYVVFVPDAYRGQLATQVPFALYLRLSTPEAEIHADLDTGLNYLRGLANVDPARVATVGFCFGGEQSLQMSLRRPDDLAATVMLYGSLVTEAARLGPLREQPFLGIFGATDAQIPVSDVRAFEAALNSLNAPATITIYEGVGHAFVTEDNYNQPGAAGEAWQQISDFLAAHLQE
jgi:carboxymethylenebutenolidase